MSKQTNLEARISDALGDGKVVADDLQRPITQIHSCNAEADALASAERSSSLDPLTTPTEAQEAQQRASIAELKRDRLRAALPRVEHRLRHLRDQYRDDWLADRRRGQVQVDQAVSILKRCPDFVCRDDRHLQRSARGRRGGGVLACNPIAGKIKGSEHVVVYVRARTFLTRDQVNQASAASPDCSMATLLLRLARNPLGHRDMHDFLVSSRTTNRPHASSPHDDNLLRHGVGGLGAPGAAGARPTAGAVLSLR